MSKYTEEQMQSNVAYAKFNSAVRWIITLLIAAGLAYSFGYRHGMVEAHTEWQEWSEKLLQEMRRDRVTEGDVQGRPKLRAP